MALLGFQVKFRKCTNLSSELGSIWKHSSAEVDCNSKLNIASTKCQNRTKDMRGFCSELARCLNMGARNRQKKLNTCAKWGFLIFMVVPPARWMVYFRENPSINVFFSWGTPMTMGTPIYENPHLWKPPWKTSKSSVPKRWICGSPRPTLTRHGVGLGARAEGEGIFRRHSLSRHLAPCNCLGKRRGNIYMTMNEICV